MRLFRWSRGPREGKMEKSGQHEAVTSGPAVKLRGATRKAAVRSSQRLMIINKAGVRGSRYDVSKPEPPNLSLPIFPTCACPRSSYCTFRQNHYHLPPGIFVANPSPREWETVRMPFGGNLVDLSTILIDEQNRSGAHDTGGIDAITHDPCDSP